MVPVTTEIHMTGAMIELLDKISDITAGEYSSAIDSMDSIVTLVESSLAGNIDLRNDHIVIMKRILPDRLFGLINDEADYQYIYDLIIECVMHMGDLLQKYDLLQRDSKVIGLNNLTKTLFVECIKHP